METKHPLWQGHTDNPLAKLKMETNELPEDVKSKIDESAKEWARNHSSAPDKETPDWIETDFRGGAEFGYRLGLQSCEEQLKAKDEARSNLYDFYENLLKERDKFETPQRIKELTKENERLRGVNEELQLFRQKESTAYANLAEKNERLRELVDRSAKMLKAIQYGVTFGKIEEYQKLLTEIDSLLTETKPE